MFEEENNSTSLNQQASTTGLFYTIFSNFIMEYRITKAVLKELLLLGEEGRKK